MSRRARNRGGRTHFERAFALDPLLETLRPQAQRELATAQEAQDQIARTRERFGKELAGRPFSWVREAGIDAAHKADDLRAEVLLRNCLERDPTDAATLVCLASICRRAGRDAEAKTLAQCVLERAPGDSGALVQLAAIERGDGFPDRAQRLIEAITGYPQLDHFAATVLAACWTAQRPLADAERLCNKILRVRSDDPYALNVLLSIPPHVETDTTRADQVRVV